MTDPLNAFTVDVEDYYQVTAFERDVSRSRWDRYESRVVANTQRLLALLARRQVKATFFILGWIGRRFPKLVRQIRQEGHEIGSHVYEHHLVYEQSPRQFRDDLRRSRDALEDAISEKVTAYRAPTFSITERSLWALEILVEEGFRVDSSVFPTRHDRYGIPGAQPGLHRIATPAGPLWELPPSVVRFTCLNVPVGGGGYFRLYPLPLTVYFLNKINKRAQRPFVFYVHPWEVDPGQPRLKAGSRMSRFRHYVNLSKTEPRLEGLLKRFHFGPVCDVVQRAHPVEQRAEALTSLHE